MRERQRDDSEALARPSLRVLQNQVNDASDLARGAIGPVITASLAANELKPDARGASEIEHALEAG
jgi:hypothetical protein